jgi:cell division protein FtsL
MKRKTLVILAAAVPLLLFANAWQVYRHERVESQVRTLVEQQKNLLEKNKRLIAAIAVLSSPDRVARLAERDLGLSKADPADIVTIIPRKRSPDG